MNELEQTAKLNANSRSELLHPLEDMADETDRQYVTALARGLELLRCFSSKDAHLGNQELSQMTGLPKPSITRFTHTLVKLGYLKHVPNSAKFQLGIGVLSLGYAMMANVSIRSIAQPYMKELAEYANANVALAMRDRLQMTYLDVIQGGNVTMRRHIGSNFPIHSTSMGRACLAALPVEERSYLLDAIRAENKDNWLPISRELDRAFKDFQDYGYCFSIGDWQKDVNSVAVPYYHQHGLLVFNCGGPSFLLSREKLEEDIAPRLLHMVNNIRSETS